MVSDKEHEIMDVTAKLDGADFIKYPRVMVIGGGSDVRVAAQLAAVLREHNFDVVVPEDFSSSMTHVGHLGVLDGYLNHFPTMADLGKCIEVYEPKWNFNHNVNNGWKKDKFHNPEDRFVGSIGGYSRKRRKKTMRKNRK